MRTENKKNGDRFDKLLKSALKQYRQPVPAGFPQRMLDKLEQLEQQKAIRKVVRQERALLAACILLPVGVIAIMLAFPDLLLVPSRLLETLYLLASQTAASMAQQWRLWTGYAIVAAVMMYAVYEVLLADN
jgi:hypothetical protein